VVVAIVMVPVEVEVEVVVVVVVRGGHSLSVGQRVGDKATTRKCARRRYF